MARSSCVYVVLDDGKPVAGFTVKHELVTWLGRNLVPQHDPAWQIWRTGDGIYQGGPYEGRPVTNITDEILTLVNEAGKL